MAIEDAAVQPDDRRPLQALWASSIGLGTYLGDPDERTDARYAEAVRAALRLGCNVLDTAISYRCQRSERLIGRTLESLIAEGAVARQALILCTKGGYLAFDGEIPANPARHAIDTILRPGLARPEELVGGSHCLAPAYLDQALRTSLDNLKVRTIDIYYLHNPEEQLAAVDRDTFHERLQAAFRLLEQRAQEGRIRYYGVATWNGLRCAPTAREYLSLETLVSLAAGVGGPDHHFRVIQLPYNLAMPEAYAFRNQTISCNHTSSGNPTGRGERLSALEAAAQLGLSVVVSASLLQGELARLSPKLSAHIPGPWTAAQRALQFVRSTPGLTTALAGMSHRAHVEENMALLGRPLMTSEELARLFDRSRSTRSRK